MRLVAKPTPHVMWSSSNGSWSDDWIGLNLFHRGSTPRPVVQNHPAASEKGANPLLFPTTVLLSQGGQLNERPWWITVRPAHRYGIISLCLSLFLQCQTTREGMMWNVRDCESEKTEEEEKEVGVKERFRVTIND